MTLNVQAGTLYDKERSERNLSTANVGVLGKIILQSEEELGTPKGESVTLGGNTPQLGEGHKKFNEDEPEEKEKDEGA